MARYVGSNETKLVHVNEPPHQRCDAVKDIPPKQRVEFSTLSGAHMAGFEDCPLCIESTPR
jgi:hypothetical protein